MVDYPHIFLWGSWFWFCIPLRLLLCTQHCHTVSFTYNFVTHHRPAFCVAGVALAWQVWHLRGRRGTCSHPPSFCMAGVALGDIYLRLAWQAWHFWHWAGSGGAPGRLLVARGTAALFWQACGTWWHRRSICVAGVALGRIHLVFAWQAWHSWHWAQHFHTRHCHTQLLHMQPFHTPLFHKKLFHKTLVFHTLDKKWIIEVIRWELNPLTCNWIRKRKTDGRYVILASQNDFTLLNRRLRWPESCWEASGPLHLWAMSKGRSFTSVQMLHTHPPGRSRVNPERQEEENKRTQTTGRRPRTVQGGKGTNGLPEPTYKAKQT